MPLLRVPSAPVTTLELPMIQKPIRLLKERTRSSPASAASCSSSVWTFSARAFVKVLAGDVLARARRHQGKGEPESTKAFSRDFIVSVVVVLAIAAGVGVV
jgi:hypothetical protein